MVRLNNFYYGTPGCGKTTMVNKYPNVFIDSDEIYNMVAKSHIKLDCEPHETGRILYNMHKSGEIENFWTIVNDTVEELKELRKKKIILTSNFFTIGLCSVLYLYDPEIRSLRFRENAIRQNSDNFNFDNLMKREDKNSHEARVYYLKENEYLSDILSV